MSSKIQFRRDTAANWTSVNPVLSMGEPALETDTGKQKVGDGVTVWTALAYQAPNAVTLSSTYPSFATAGLVSVSNTSGDATTILSAITAQTTAGKATGDFETVQGKLARISSPTTINLGYSNTQAANWATDTTHEKVRLKLDLLPDANLGSALTIKGGYGVELDINVLGGGARGSVTDAAVTAGSNVISSPAAIAAGLAPGAVVFLTGAGPVPEGIVQPLAASVRTVNAGAGTFTVSEAAETAVSGASMNWFDVAIRLEDCVGLKLNVYGKGFQGYLIAADATDDTSKRLRSCNFGTVTSNGCAGAFFWKKIEAFGSMGKIFSNTIAGDYLGQCDDLHWDHWEGGVAQPITGVNPRAYLWFDRCGQVNNLSVSVGDRATETAVLMTGNTGSNVGSMGRFAQVRATMYQALAQAAITSGTNTLTNVTSNSLTMRVGMTIVGPGIPDGTTVTAVTGTGSYTGGVTGTITMSANATATNANTQVYGCTADGLKLIGIQGVTITHLDTAKSVAGLHIIGGGGVGIRIMKHVSYSSDVTPVVIEGGTTGVPRVRIDADYRYHGSYSVDLKSSLTTGAEVRLSGHIEGGHQFDGGASGKYIARSGSTATVLDISGLRSKALSGATGFIDPATVALKGASRARLENNIPTAGQVYQTDGAGDFVLATPTSGGTGASYFDPALYTKYLAWTMDPATCGLGTTGVAATGRPQLSMIPVTAAITASGLSVVIATAGSGTTWTSGQNFMVLKDSTGTILAQTADITSVLSAAAAGSEVTAVLASPVSLSTGRVYVELLINWSAGTAPTFLAAKSLAGTSMNLGTPTAYPRSASDSVARTAPASKAITALSASQQSLIWAAIN